MSLPQFLTNRAFQQLSGRFQILQSWSVDLSPEEVKISKMLETLEKQVKEDCSDIHSFNVAHMINKLEATFNSLIDSVNNLIYDIKRILNSESNKKAEEKLKCLESEFDQWYVAYTTRCYGSDEHWEGYTGKSPNMILKQLEELHTECVFS